MYRWCKIRRVTAAVGTAAALSLTSAAAGVLQAGQWALQIAATPTKTLATPYGLGSTYTSFDFGTDSAYNSSFTWSTLPGTPGASQSLTDNGTLVRGAGSGVTSNHW